MAHKYVENVLEVIDRIETISIYADAQTKFVYDHVAFLLLCSIEFVFI